MCQGKYEGTSVDLPNSDQPATSCQTGRLFFFIYPNWTSAIDACFPRLVRELRPQLEISLLDGWLQHDATWPKWFLAVGRKLCQFPQKPFSEVRRIGVGLDGKHHEGGWMGYRGVEEAE